MNHINSIVSAQIRRKQEKLLNYRLVVACMVFLSALVTSMMKVDLPFTSIALLRPNLTISLIQCGVKSTWQEQTHFQSLNIVRRQVGLLISSYFIGASCTILSGDVISDTLGPVWAIGGFTILASLMTSVIPYIINLNFYAALFNRFVVGVCAGPIVPSCYKIFVNWAPPNESKRFFYVLVGLYSSAIVVWPLLGVTISYKGWKWGFFTTGIIGFAWSFVWLILVSNTPDENFFISQSEIKYIKKCQGKFVKRVPVAVPYCDIFKSGPVWAYIFLELGGIWIGVAYMLTMPQFLNDTSDITILQNGLYSAMPPLAKLLGGVAFTHIYNKAVNSRQKPLTVQKIFTIISHFIPGCIALIVLLVHCQPRWVVSLIFIALGLNGASYVTSLNYLQGLTVNYTFTIYNYGVLFPITILFIPVPLLTAELMEVLHPGFVWNCVILTMAAIFFVSGGVFMVKASSDPQRWDDFEPAVSSAENEIF